MAVIAILPRIQMRDRSIETSETRTTDVNLKSGMVFRPSVEPAGGRRETFQVPLLECGSSVPLPLAPNEIVICKKMETT